MLSATILQNLNLIPTCAWRNKKYNLQIMLRGKLNQIL
jgi:hypothetical protein